MMYRHKWLSARLVLPCLVALHLWVWPVSLMGQSLTRSDRFDNEGRLHIKNKEWPEAVDYYRDRLEVTSFAPERADFRFWLAYALEQIPGSEEQAFNAYAHLIEFHEESSWCDDGRIHQVMVARKLVAAGKKRYVDFLLQKLQAPQREVRFHAAFALAPLRHPRALPILVEAAAQPEVQIVRDAVYALKNYEAIRERSDFEPSAKANHVQPLTVEQTVLIRDRLRKPNSGWNRQTLQLNGLFHIVSAKVLAHYLGLPSKAQRDFWWMQFWKAKDPTPTTPENEAEVEFNRRVDYVFDHFKRDWDMATRGYPPWDARGEVYIRFGPPDESRDAGQSWEEWSYYPKRLILYVDGKTPNVHGEGVSTAGVTAYLHSVLDEENEYPVRLSGQQPEFQYRYPITPKLHAMEIHKEAMGQSGQFLDLRFQFVFPADKLRLIQLSNRRRGQYLLRWVVMDEQYNDVARGQVGREVLLEGDVLESASVEVIQEARLSSGRYVLAVHLEDQKSTQFGIFKEMFRVIRENSGALRLR